MIQGTVHTRGQDEMGSADILLTGFGPFPGVEDNPTQRVVEELAFLANVLIAGDAGRAWRPAEAAERVLALCDVGLRELTRADASAPRDLLAAWGAVGLFRRAYACGPEPAQTGPGGSRADSPRGRCSPRRPGGR